MNTQNFQNVFTAIGKFMHLLFTNTYAVFALTVVFFTMMLYSIFIVLLGKIPIFSGEGNAGTNKYGKIVALSLSILSSSGIFSVVYFNGGAGGIMSLRQTLEKFLGPYAILAGVIMALLMFSIIYFGYGSTDQNSRWKTGMWGAGTALIFFGWMLNRPSIFSVGWFIVFIMLLFLLFSRYPISPLASNNQNRTGGGAGGGTGGGGAGGGGTGGGAGGGGGGNRNPPDFTRALNELTRLLNDYDNRFQQFKTWGNTLLQKNYLYLRSLGGYGPPSAPVTGAELDQLLTMLTALDQTGVAINNLINTIITDPQFSRMNPAEQSRFGTESSRWSSYLTRTRTYTAEFTNRYANGLQPVP